MAGLFVELEAWRYHFLEVRVTHPSIGKWRGVGGQAALRGKQR